MGAAEALLERLKSAAEQARAAAMQYAQDALPKAKGKRGKSRRSRRMKEEDKSPSLMDRWSEAWAAEDDVSECRRRQRGASRASLSWAGKAGGAALLIVGNLLVLVDAQDHTHFLEVPEPDCGMDKATAIMQDTNAACNVDFNINHGPGASRFALRLVDGL